MITSVQTPNQQTCRVYLVGYCSSSRREQSHASGSRASRTHPNGQIPVLQSIGSAIEKNNAGQDMGCVDLEMQAKTLRADVWLHELSKCTMSTPIVALHRENSGLSRRAPQRIAQRSSPRCLSGPGIPAWTAGVILKQVFCSGLDRGL